jgi:drug/metabolite transporter (DMT)-like permease
VLLFGVLTISTGSVLIRYAQAYAPSLVIAAVRMILATLVLAPVALTCQHGELIKLSRGELGLAGLSGIFLALHFALWITSLEYTSVASSVVFVTSTPLWVAMLSPLILKEPISRRVLIGMALALTGGVIIGLSDACTLDGWSLTCPGLADFFLGRAILGDLLALGGAIAAAFYVLIGRRLRAKYSLVTYIFMVYGGAAIVLGLSMLASGGSLLGYPPAAYLWFGLIALLPQLLGHSSFNWALGYVSAALVSVALLCEPIGAILLAYIFLGEAPSPLKLFGAILILMGITIASRGK